MKLRRPRILIERPDIAPMADIVLLLLIFFMLSTSFVTDPGIKVNLPQAVTSEIDPKQNLFLVIEKNGRISMNKQTVAKTALASELRKEIERSGDRLLVIRADKDISHGFVVEVMDIARQAGIERLAIAAEIKKR